MSWTGSEGASHAREGSPRISRGRGGAPNRRALRKSLRTNFNPGFRTYRNRGILRAKQVLNIPYYLAGRTLHRPVFIIGAPRSGTSMLFTILHRSRSLSNWASGESHEVWERDFHPALTGWKSNVLRKGEPDIAANRRIKRSFFLATGPRKRFFDKTPRNSLRVEFIDSLFPDAQYVFLTRDGRENVNSLINAWRTGRYRTYALDHPHSIPGVDPNWWKFTLYEGWEEDSSGPLEVVCAKQWKSSYEQALAAFEGIERTRWSKVAYEDLVDDPVGVTRGIMDFLGLEFEEQVRLQAEASKTKPVNTVTPPERGKWRRENPREIEAILPLITPTMKALGYEMED
jgi:LPS sulfotransferase NodH